MVYASQFFISFLVAAGAVFASPVLDNELEGRASPRCKVHAEGYLPTALLKNSKGTLTSHWKPFTFNVRQELSYMNGGGKQPIWVHSSDFQETMYWGRIYLPAYKQCLAVENSDETGPYFIRRALCLNSEMGEMKTKKSIPQNFAYRTFSSDTNCRIIFWTGATKADWSSFQGKCDGGTFGYQLRPNNEPVTYSGGKVKAVCNSNAKVATIFAELRVKPSN